MISEPELDGGTGFVVAETLTEERQPKPPRPPRARRPWLWGLGGAVLASAVWGGGLLAYRSTTEPGPDLRGYGPVDNLCGTVELKALAGVLGKRSEDGTSPGLDDPAVYETSCSVTFGPPESGYSVALSYTLHKVTDPEPEFAPRAKYYQVGTLVEGLGEQAFFDSRGDQGGELRVLDGQAELTMSIYENHNVDPDGNPVQQTKPIDLTGIDVPMTQDMMAVMATLKK
ncbi:hypothetical protein [Streptomyces venezuelae]|uniref:hypothetical protein n=1 Tax=Streptomyces venezuelae TaxID=54571 RepID=UPI00278C4BE7|nr:hypothetical protein [Streptomyces venezuelae]